MDGGLVLTDLGGELIGLGAALRHLVGRGLGAREARALLCELRLLLSDGVLGRLARALCGVQVRRGLVVCGHRVVALLA